MNVLTSQNISTDTGNWSEKLVSFDSEKRTWRRAQFQGLILYELIISWIPSLVEKQSPLLPHTPSAFYLTTRWEVTSRLFNDSPDKSSIELKYGHVLSPGCLLTKRSHPSMKFQFWLCGPVLGAPGAMAARQLVPMGPPIGCRRRRWPPPGWRLVRPSCRWWPHLPLPHEGGCRAWTLKLSRRVRKQLSSCIDFLNHARLVN